MWTGSGARPEDLECAWPAGEDELARGGASRGAGEVADGWAEGRWAWRRTDGLAGAGRGGGRTASRELGTACCCSGMGGRRTGAPDGRAELAGGVWLLRGDGGMRALAGGVLVLWEMER